MRLDLPRQIQKLFLRIFLFGLVAASAVGALSGCMSAYKKSVGANQEDVFTRIYLTDFESAWAAVIETLKSYPLDISNKESGVVQTKWKDNTEARNSAESFLQTNIYHKAQLRVRVTLSKGFFNGQNSVKVVIQKEQLAQQDVLEGWRPLPTDGTDEKTMLYRIGRIIYMRGELARMEEARAKKELQLPSFEEMNASPPDGLDWESSDPDPFDSL